MGSGGAGANGSRIARGTGMPQPIGHAGKSGGLWQIVVALKRMRDAIERQHSIQVEDIYAEQDYPMRRRRI
ncbi:MAG: hypothetical protein BWY87_00259 [Deltaproteobacteria bacterium ADurb.Bin510]|nr:MAG: hypothetical protein BWY87_00259 [Deltaproteobacteria bacterium ADurb.Bin510]